MGGLIPVEYATEIMGKTIEKSNALRLARKLRNMPTSVRTMPVLDVLPTAYFVTGDTGLKQTSNASWKGVNITAEELAVIVPVPQAAFDDSAFPIWDEVKPLIEEAAGVAIDAAVFHGVNVPASWATTLGATGIVGSADNGVTGNSVSLAGQIDMYDAIMGETGVLAALEADGFICTGHVAAPAMRSKLRGTRSADGVPLFAPSMQAGGAYLLDGQPIFFPTNGAIDSTKAYDIAGQWDQLVYAWRMDMNWMIADQAVITDQAGQVVYNLFQQDMIALRMTLRLGFALPNPINRLQQTAANRWPFAILKA
jgi:HK97 family phage major capsid protein